MHFVVNEINEDLILSENYYSNRNLAVFPDNLMKDGMERQPIRPSPSAVNSASYPPLRLHLEESLAQRLMSPADPGVLSGDAAFRSYFKGIQVSTLAEPDGGVFNVDLTDPASKLTVYYRDLDGAEPDTTSYTFSITSDCARFTRFEHYYGGTPLEALGDGVVNDQALGYIQAGSGTKVKIDIPHLETLNGYDSRTVNGAQLIVPFEDDGRYRAQDQLVLLYVDESGDLRALPDQVSQTIGGAGDFVRDEYRFRIERYVQKVLNGDISSQGLYLLSTRAGVSVNRLVCRGPGFDPSDRTRNMRLILTFTAD
jgi:hypothetical protein